MAIRYIGSKARIAEQILDVIEGSIEANGRFVDGFCGTGIVSKVAADRGWSIVANDALKSSTIITAASLLSSEDVRFAKLGSYTNALSILNKANPMHGFMYRTYSPASACYCDFERRYFTKINAGRIDAIRETISLWADQGLISRPEEILLLADLIEAANDVANTAGTYGCFLKKWTDNSEKPLLLKPTALRKKHVDFRVLNKDVFGLTLQRSDVVYLDPPYTKRQYASYYHIAETIAFGDEPMVEGVAGLRPWKEKASPFCYKTKALNALEECSSRMDAGNIYYSYSSQGHVSLNDLVERLERHGRVEVHSLGEIGRYRPNKVAAESGSQVTEYLIHLKKSDGRSS